MSMYLGLSLIKHAPGNSTSTPRQIALLDGVITEIVYSGGNTVVARFRRKKGKKVHYLTECWISILSSV